MLSRITVNVLLKSVIATLALAVVVMLAMGAWSSWNRLAAISRIASVSEASGHLFKALHLLRTDRATTTRDLNSEQALPSMTQQLVEIRAVNLPALKAGLAVLASADFPEKQEAISSLDQAINKLEALHKETAAAFLQPKASRRAKLSQEFFKTTTDLMALIDKISTQMVRSVKLDDAFVDQLLTIKQLAWVARNTGGDASVMISNALGGLPLPPDAMFRYHANVGKVETAWAAIEDVASGLPLPAPFWAAVEKGTNGIFWARVHRASHEDAQGAGRRRKSRHESPGLVARDRLQARGASGRR